MLLDDALLPLQPLGHGASGIVFLASAPPDSSAALFAIKAFRRSRDHDLQHADNEENILSALLRASLRKPTPFLPRLHRAFDHGEFRFLVLDYCAGGDLNALRQSLPEKRFSTASIRFYAAEIVLALERLHEEGIVYRDLKPENILLSSDGHVMVTDFDLSVTLPPKRPTPLPPSQTAANSLAPDDGEEDDDPDEDGDEVSSMACLGGRRGGKQRYKRTQQTAPRQRSRHRVVPAPGSSAEDPLPAQVISNGPSSDAVSKSFVGTEDYIAPEVIKGTGHDFAVDWWGLGILLFEMAHARTPFSGRTTKQTFQNILHEEPVLSARGPLKDLILRLLVKNPSERLGSRNGAAEIKAHRFFAGVQWDLLQDVLRPPFITASDPPSRSGDGFDITDHLLQVECARSEARARRRLHQKQGT